MLSDEDRQRIREEEIFRQEVQQTLKKTIPHGPWRTRVWGFLNSGVGIWLLTSVLVGLATFSFQRYDQRKQEDRQLSETIRRSNVEIAARLHDLTVFIDTRYAEFEDEISNPDDCCDPSLTAAILADDIRNYIQSTGGLYEHQQVSIFPEFREVSLLGIVQTLEVISNGEEAELVNRAQLDLLDIADKGAAYSNAWGIGSDTPLEQIQSDLSQFVDDIRRTLGAETFKAWISL